MNYSKEAVMMALIAADVSEEKANEVVSLLEVAQNNTVTEKNSKAYKRWMLSTGSYAVMERKAMEFDEQDIVY